MLYIIIAKENTTYGWWYTPTAMIYTLKRDDMPLLSQWIKKTMENVSFSFVFLERITGDEAKTVNDRFRRRKSTK